MKAELNKYRLDDIVKDRVLNIMKDFINNSRYLYLLAFLFIMLFIIGLSLYLGAYFEPIRCDSSNAWGVYFQDIASVQIKVINLWAFIIVAISGMCLGIIIYLYKTKQKLYNKNQHYSCKVKHELDSYSLVKLMPVPGRRCPACLERGLTVWVIPGKCYPQCGTPVN